MSTDKRDQRRAAARAEREATERHAAAADARRRRLLQLGSALLAAAAIVAVVILVAGSGGGGDQSSAGATSTTGALSGEAEIADQLDGIPQNGIALGKPDAPITVVEFGDLQCPACAAFSNGEMPKLVDQYIRPGKARMEFRSLTFIGDDSKRLALMSAAASEQDKLFQFNELVYANQGAENSGYATDAYLRRIGGAIAGFDVDAALRARDGHAAAQQLVDTERLASINGVQSTPSFLVGRTGGEMKLVDAQELGVELESLAQATAPQT